MTPEPMSNPPDTDTVSPVEYKHAMRRVVSSVAVVTTQSQTERDGLTATAICSATSMPPTILVCVNRKASALHLIQSSGIFAVNFLSDAHSSLARAFSTRGLSGETRMGAGTWTKFVTGAPVLPDALSSFDCVLEKSMACGAHEVLFGRVVAVACTEDSALLYRDGFFRRVAPE